MRAAVTGGASGTSHGPVHWAPRFSTRSTDSASAGAGPCGAAPGQVLALALASCFTRGAGCGAGAFQPGSSGWRPCRWGNSQEERAWPGAPRAGVPLLLAVRGLGPEGSRESFACISSFVRTASRSALECGPRWLTTCPGSPRRTLAPLGPRGAELASGRVPRWACGGRVGARHVRVAGPGWACVGLSLFPVCPTLPGPPWGSHPVSSLARPGFLFSRPGGLRAHTLFTLLWSG